MSIPYNEHHAEMLVWVVDAEWRHRYISSQLIAPVEHCFSVMLTVLVLLLASLHSTIARGMGTLNLNKTLK